MESCLTPTVGYCCQVLFLIRFLNRYYYYFIFMLLLNSNSVTTRRLYRLYFPSNHQIKILCKRRSSSQSTASIFHKQLIYDSSRKATSLFPLLFSVHCLVSLVSKVPVYRTGGFDSIYGWTNTQRLKTSAFLSSLPGQPSQ